MDNLSESELPKNGDKSEIEKKLVEVEALLNDLTDSDIEDTWDDEEMANNEKVLQFVLNSVTNVEEPADPVEVKNSFALGCIKHNLRMRSLNKFQLNTRTGLSKTLIYNPPSTLLYSSEGPREHGGVPNCAARLFTYRFSHG